MCIRCGVLASVGFSCLLETVPCVCGYSRKEIQWCHQLESPSEIHLKPGDVEGGRERERERERERRERGRSGRDERKARDGSLQSVISNTTI